MHPDTFDVLKDAKMVSSDRLAYAIAALLESDLYNGANGNGGGADEDARIVDEIRSELLGDDYGDHVVEELNEMVGELTRPMGAVYEMLSDGLSLCTARVRRRVVREDGSTIVVAKMGRFVSADADVVVRYRLDPAVQRLERTMERMSDQLERDTERIPALAAKVRPLIGRAHRTMNAALPAPAPQSNSGDDDE